MLLSRHLFTLLHASSSEAESFYLPWSHVTVSKTRVIDTNLAVKRLGLAEEEEKEVKSIKRLVKAGPSEALLSQTSVRVLPLGSDLCMHLAAAGPTPASLGLVAAQDCCKGCGFSNLPE